MERKMQMGYLVLVDISGYTSFIVNTEIEHAEMAISILLEAVIEKLKGLLTIVKLEGDAVFAYMPEDQLSNGSAMLELIDTTYHTFRESAKSLHARATCPCKACEAIPSLDLKFLIHHGEYILQQVAGIRDLLGHDVTLLHRLAKNHVSESTGWRGYALFTTQGLDRMQVTREPFVKQSEEYEHLGRVDIHLMNMHDRYGKMKDKL